MHRRVVLLRHAAPAVRSDQASSLWPVSAAGRRAAADIGVRLPVAAALGSSPELKAIETICLAAATTAAAVQIDDRFGEVRRPGEPFDDDFKSRRLAWVTGRLDERHSTWESPEEAAARFQAALHALVGETVVVASHGMVIVSWLTQVGYVPHGDAAGDFWTSLRFPALVDVTVG